jgi:type II secretory pathway pseudopilin PulG
MKYLSSIDKCGKKIRQLTAGQEGFTILEGMVAAAIFGICMMSVVGMLVGTFNTNNVSRDVTEATARGADVIERIARLDYFDNRLQTNTFTLPDSDDGKYSYAVNITLNDIMDNTMSIAVAVSWRDRGRTRSVVINDIRADII